MTARAAGERTEPRRHARAGGHDLEDVCRGVARAGFTGAGAGRYAKKHNPLVYFTDVVSRPDRLRRIVPLGSFAEIWRQVGSRTSRWSFPTCATTCTTAPSRPETRGFGRSFARSWVPGAPARGRLRRVRRGRLGRRGRGSCPCARPRAARASRITHLDAARPLRAAADDRGRLGPALSRAVPRLTGDHGHLALADWTWRCDSEAWIGALAFTIGAHDARPSSLSRDVSCQWGGGCGGADDRSCCGGGAWLALAADRRRGGGTRSRV